MARETPGGREGRTVYLPPEVWAQLEAFAQGFKSHPAFQRHEIRSGSVSSVIEKIVTWDAPAQLARMERQVQEANLKLSAARKLRFSAATLITQMDRLHGEIMAALIQVRDTEV